MSGGSRPAGRHPRAARARLARVRKRDGRIVPWDKRKIEAAVEKALEAVSEPDPTFAREVADLVELALSERAAAAPAAGADDDRIDVVPGIEEIQDLVERALVELGRAAPAKAYILYRDRRARARAALAQPREHEAGGAARVRVRESEGTEAWEKGRVVAALMDEAELPRAVAEDVAARVERRILASGLRTVASGLVRELVAGELLELGLDAARVRQASIGVARPEVRRILRDPAAEPWDDARLADRQPEVLRALRAHAERAGLELGERFAAEEVLGAGGADLHRAGDLEVVDLGAVHRPLAIAIPAELLVQGEPGPDAAFAALRPLADLLRGVGRAVVIEDPSALFQPLPRVARERADGLRPWLAALAGLARASARAVGIASPGPRHAALSAHLVAELAPLAGDPCAPTLYLEDDAVEAALAAGLEDELEALLAAGRAVPTFGAEGRRCVGPGLLRLRRERGALAASGAVALNLPRLARRAGPWSEAAFLASLADLVRCAVDVCASLFAFQSELPAFLPARLSARPSFALVPVGLREALRALGDGEIDPDRGARVLGLCAEAARRFAPPGLPRIDLSPFFGERARARFAHHDRRDLAREGRNQRWLFADAELRREGGSAPGGAYAEGYVLAPVRGLYPGQAEGELLKTVVAGALTLARGVAPLDAVDPDARRPCLDFRRRFHELLRARRAAEVELLFPASRARRGGASLAQEPA